MSETIPLDDLDAATRRVVAAIRDGLLAVVPTDTVYALVADAFSTAGTQRLFAAKGRGRDAPLSLLIRNPRQVIGLAREVPETAERLMASYWPGPASLLLPVQPSMPWDLGDLGDVVGLRMPADDLVLAVAADVGPLACSSANRRGEVPATTVDEARLQLGGSVAVYVDGGDRPGPVSTVVDCSGERVRVLREGAVPIADVEAVASGTVGWGQRPDRVEQPGETA